MKIRLLALFTIIVLSGCQDLLISAEEKINMAEAQIRGDETDYETLEKVIGWLREEASEGNPDAMYWLARAHYKGLGVERNHEEMVELLKAGSAKGHTQSTFRLGQAFRWGFGVDQDMKAAVSYYERAIDAGSHNAMGDLAQLLYYADRYEDVEQDFQRSFRLAKHGAGGGSDFAMSILATHYLERQSGFYNPEMAVQTLEEIIARGNPSKTLPDEFLRKDRMALAFLYMGIPAGSEGVIDLEKAEQLLIENAENPKSAGEAFYSLAEIERNKMTEAEDDKMSGLIESRRSYLRKSADLGNPSAATLLCFEYAKNWQDDSHEYHQKIPNWCNAGAEDGDRTSQFNTGVILKDKDPTDALSWFTLAAMQGHSDARRILDSFASSLSEDQRARATTKTRRYLKNNAGVYQSIQDRNLAK